MGSYRVPQQAAEKYPDVLKPRAITVLVVNAQPCWPLSLEGWRSGPSFTYSPKIFQSQPPGHHSGSPRTAWEGLNVLKNTKPSSCRTLTLHPAQKLGLTAANTSLWEITDLKNKVGRTEVFLSTQHPWGEPSVTADPTGNLPTRGAASKGSPGPTARLQLPAVFLPGSLTGFPGPQASLLHFCTPGCPSRWGAWL